MSLNAQIAATMQIDLTGAASVGGAVPSFSKPKSADIALTDGAASGQAQKVHASTRSLASGALEDLDLAGVLTDPFGVVLTFGTIKGIVIRADPANATNLTVGGAPSNAFQGPFGATTHTLTLRPGGAIVLAAPQTGWTVAGATGDLLRVANASGAVANYSIEIIGT